MASRTLTLRVLPGHFAVCQLKNDSPVPKWVLQGAFVSITRTDEELSIVCAEESVPAEVRAERGWRCLKVCGPFAFTEVGVLASLTEPLARAGISLFAVSTFDTDYILIQEPDLERALQALLSAGHRQLV